MFSRTARKGVLGYADLTPEVMASHKVIVNTTPLGMYPKVDSCPDIPYECLTPDHLLYDLIYNPDVTAFMKKGAARGLRSRTDSRCCCCRHLRRGEYGMRIENKIIVITKSYA